MDRLPDSYKAPYSVLYSIAKEMSKSQDRQAVRNGDFPVNNQGSTFLEYTLGDWNEVGDTDMAPKF